MNNRFDTDPVGRRFDIDSDQPIVEAVAQIAEARGVPMACVALAWVLKNPVVTAPIVGATKPHHLPDAVAALDVHLTENEIRTLDEPYAPDQPTALLTGLDVRRPRTLDAAARPRAAPSDADRTKGARRDDLDQ